MLIAFEGIDKTGKTTQSNLLFKYFKKQNKDVEIIKFPDRTTKIGQLINEFLKGKINLDLNVVNLLFIANRLEKKEYIKNSLKKGKIIILDRYIYSGKAYTLATGGPALFYKIDEQLMPRPDKVFYLSAVDIEKREGFGEEVYEKTEFQKKVSEEFEKIKEDNFITIKGNYSIKDIHNEIIILL